MAYIGRYCPTQVLRWVRKGPLRILSRGAAPMSAITSDYLAGLLGFLEGRRAPRGLSQPNRLIPDPDRDHASPIRDDADPTNHSHIDGWKTVVREIERLRPRASDRRRMTTVNLEDAPA